MPSASCPECASLVNVSGTPQPGDGAHCSHCRTPLRVVALHPLELTWAEEYYKEEEEEGNDGD